MIKRMCIMALFLTSCATTVKVDDHRKLASELVDLVSDKESTVVIMRTSMYPFIQQLKDDGVPQYKIIQINHVIDEFIQDFIDDQTVKSRMVDLYEAEFSAEELKAILDFYQRPVGQKTLEKFPDLFQKGAEIGMEIARKYQAEFGEKVGRILSEK